MRKAYTAGFYATGIAGFDSDRIPAFPTADITIYGIKAIHPPSKERHLSEESRETIRDFAKESSSVWSYVETGRVDSVISYDKIRAEIERFLERTVSGLPDRTGPRRVLCV
jgi:acetyl-CoA carboxylase carboxyltransferase component